MDTTNIVENKHVHNAFIFIFSLFNFVLELCYFVVLQQQNHDFENVGMYYYYLKEFVIIFSFVESLFSFCYIHLHLKPRFVRWCELLYTFNFIIHLVEIVIFSIYFIKFYNSGQDLVSYIISGLKCLSWVVLRYQYCYERFCNQTHPPLFKKVSSIEEECSICYSSMMEGEIVSLECEHLFHLTCIEKWLYSDVSNLKIKSCPYCRTDIL